MFDLILRRLLRRTDLTLTVRAQHWGIKRTQNGYENIDSFTIGSTISFSQLHAAANRRGGVQFFGRGGLPSLTAEMRIDAIRNPHTRLFEIAK
jgi:hypothetical protein